MTKCAKMEHLGKNVPKWNVCYPLNHAIIDYLVFLRSA